MGLSNIVLYEPEYRRMKSVLAKLQRELQADLVLLIDRSGQQIAAEGRANYIDSIGLASLAAANLAATDGLARLVGEPGFSVLYHQGKHRSIYLSAVSKQLSLVLVVGGSTSPGMLRWKAKRAIAGLNNIFQDFVERQAAQCRASSHEPSAPCFTDEEIEKLFARLKLRPGAQRKV